MLTRMTGLPPGIEGSKASGMVSKEDYEQVFGPLLEELRKSGRRVRFLYQLGEEFAGFTAGGAWEDAKLGLRYMRLFDGCAIVSDVAWIRESARLMGFLMPCPVKVFGNQECDKAVEWLGSLPEGPAVSHRLLSETGVVLIEVKEALRAQDFDALAATADPWIQTHGALTGIVIHAREFPGWENLDSLLRHVRFVRAHFGKVKRIAIAADSKLARLAPRLGEPFARTEVKSFAFSELNSAIEWAGRISEHGAAA